MRVKGCMAGWGFSRRPDVENGGWELGDGRPLRTTGVGIRAMTRGKEKRRKALPLVPTHPGT